MSEKTKNVPSAEASENLSLLPILKRKYMTSMILILLLSFFSWVLIDKVSSVWQVWVMIGVYVVFAVSLLILFGLYQDFFWAKINRHWRPFIVAGYVKYMLTLTTIASVVATLPGAIVTQSWMIYIFFWVLSCFLTYQMYDVFLVAHDAKTKHPDRCEFC